MSHGEQINAAIRHASVVWHECQACGRDWPFPTGTGPEREWECAICVNAALSAVKRAAVAQG